MKKICFFSTSGRLVLLTVVRFIGKGVLVRPVPQETQVIFELGPSTHLVATLKRKTKHSHLVNDWEVVVFKRG